MSWQSLAAVFEYVSTQDDLTSNDVLVLTTIAHHADQHGEHAYPSLPTIAQYTKLKRRTIQYALRHLEGTKKVLETVLQPGRHGRQTYRLLLPHVDISKGASPAPLVEKKGARPAPFDEGKGAPPAQKGASPAPDPGLRSGKNKPCAHAPEEKGTPKDQETQERPDDVLSRLDAPTVASLETAALTLLQTEGVSTHLRIKPVIQSYMVRLWYQQRDVVHEGVVIGTGRRDAEEGKAHATCAA
jgi:hypothetical protein